MKPTKEIIGALRRAADRVNSSDGGWEWATPYRCNCGIFLQELLGVNEEYLREYLSTDSRFGTWTAKAGMEDGLPSRLVGQICDEFGLEPKDFWRMEYLKEPHVSTFCEPQKVSEWMYAEANRLEQQLISQKSLERKADVQTQSVQLR